MTKKKTTHKKILDLKTVTGKDIFEIFKSLYNIIYITECYGVKDLIIYSECEKELLRRKFNIEEINSVKISK